MGHIGSWPSGMFGIPDAGTESDNEEATMEDEEIYEEFTCWLCDAVATPIYDEEGNIIGNHCRARCDDPGC